MTVFQCPALAGEAADRLSPQGDAGPIRGTIDLSGGGF